MTVHRLDPSGPDSPFTRTLQKRFRDQLSCLLFGRSGWKLENLRGIERICESRRCALGCGRPGLRESVRQLILC